jgi:hypothetical protein
MRRVNGRFEECWRESHYFANEDQAARVPAPHRCARERPGLAHDQLAPRPLGRPQLRGLYKNKLPLAPLPHLRHNYPVSSQGALMAKRRYRRYRRRDNVAEGIAVLFILGGFYLLSLWDRQPPEGKLFLIIAGSVVILSGIGFMIVVWVYRQRQRRLAWQRALSAQRGSAQTGAASRFASARQLSPFELERFAAQVYRKMGYRVTHTGSAGGDHGIDVRLVSPDGGIELVQCKQWNKPVGEPEIRDLYGTMAHEKAIRGIVWAPGGFTPAARRWAAGKPIELADNAMIARLVESAYAE